MGREGERYRGGERRIEGRGGGARKRDSEREERGRARKREREREGTRASEREIER